MEPSGLVVFTQPGAVTITVSNSVQTASATFQVTQFNPISLGQLAIAAGANNVKASGSFAYVTNPNGLSIVDISNPLFPALAGSVLLGGNAVDLVVRNNLVYVANGSNLAVVDVSTPSAPILAKTLSTGGNVQAVFLSTDSSKLYIGDSQGLKVASLVNNPRFPSLGASLALPGGVTGIAIGGSNSNLAFVAQGSKVSIVDVSAPNPVLASAVSMTADGVSAAGNFAYVAGEFNGIQIIDATTPSSPTIAGVANLAGMFVSGTAARGSLVFPADPTIVNAMPIFNVSDPASPSYVGLLRFTGNGAVHVKTRVDANDNLVFVVADGQTLAIGMYTAPTPPVPPTISVTSPAPAKNVADGGVVTISAAASDAIGVQKVDFLVNGVAQVSVSQPPYIADVRLPVGSIGQTVALGARATNLANIASGVSTVLVNDVGDPLTTVAGRAIAADGSPIANAFVTAFTSITARSQADGSFTILAVPTLLGNIPVTASISTAGATLSASTSAFPVSGGITSVGSLVLVSSGPTLGGVVTGRLNAAYNPYSVTSNILVPQGQTLTIDPGVELKIASGVNFQVDGTLIVNGSPGSEVYFTSLKDDAVGGHTGPGLSSTPSLGDWGTLMFTETSNNCAINSAIVRYGHGANLLSAFPVFNNSRFDKNFNGAMQMDVNSFPSGQGNEASGNADPNQLPLSVNGIVVNGRYLVTSGTWSLTGMPYLVGVNGTPYFHVGVGTTAVQLSVGPGVIVKSDHTFFVDDGLFVAGTASNPVIFTSADDDAAGGPAHNFPGNPLVLSGGMEFTSTSTVSRLQNAIIRRGSNDFGAVVSVVGVSPVIDGGEISHGPSDGMTLESTAGSLTMSNSSVINNGQAGINARRMRAGRIMLQGNHFAHNGEVSPLSGTPYGGLEINPNVFPVDQGGNTQDHNGLNAIRVLGGTMYSSGTWPALFPYFIGGFNSGDFFVGTGTTGVQWTLAPGVIVKLSGSTSVVVYDQLNAVGTGAQPIVFTSANDDSVGGPLLLVPNTPARGDWASLQFIGHGSDGSRLQHAIVRYGAGFGTFYEPAGEGPAANGAVRAVDASPLISSCSIEQNQFDGLGFEGTSVSTVTASSVTASGIGIIITRGAFPTVHKNSIFSNPNNGLQVQGFTPAVPIDATNNWWGDSSGPHNASSNPSGVGNGVTDGVTFIPFLTAPPPGVGP